MVRIGGAMRDARRPPLQKLMTSRAIWAVDE
jgi:hypothetical protein